MNYPLDNGTMVSGVSLYIFLSNFCCVIISFRFFNYCIRFCGSFYFHFEKSSEI